jgi:hypothetical protein
LFVVVYVLFVCCGCLIGMLMAGIAAVCVDRQRLPVQDWKKAGRPADCRSIAAVVALDALRSSQYRGIGGLWVGCLLFRRGLFRRKVDSVISVSYGFEAYAAAAWQVQVLADGIFRVAPGDADDKAITSKRLHMLTTFELGAPGSEAAEEFEGIPFEECQKLSLAHLRYAFFSQCRNGLPHWLMFLIDCNYVLNTKTHVLFFSFIIPFVRLVYGSKVRQMICQWRCKAMGSFCDRLAPARPGAVLVGATQTV